MADSDEFEIDIYGESEHGQDDSMGHDAIDGSEAYETKEPAQSADDQIVEQVNGTVVRLDGATLNEQDHRDSRGSVPAQDLAQPHKYREGSTQAVAQQGLKRKEAPDDRSLDPHASSALLLTDLNWWNTEDDMRAWAHRNGCEDELKDVTFSEHKVNGKSKGQAYMEFTSPHAATALKRYLETTVIPSWVPASKRLHVAFSNPNNNPFRTLPKDAPTRNGTAPGGRGGFSGNNDRAGAYSSFGARGKGMGVRGNFNARGNFNQGMAGNFGAGGFQGNAMGGHMNYNRGGMMQMGAMRGGMVGLGRGGAGFPQMSMGGGMMPNMAMAGFGAPMGMMPGYGAPAQGYMNPALFGAAGQQMGVNDWNNPHGAKRPRGE